MKKRASVGLLALSGAGLVALTQLEGFEERVYIPVPGDMPTAGYGHADPRLEVGKLISKQQALQWLDEDTKVAQEAVRRYVRVPLTQSEFDAYTLFVYNVGAGSFRSSTLLKKLNDARYEEACEELKRWVYSGGVKYNGLVNRRNIEMMMCKEGIYPNER